jgi:diacylglycerol kinase family enzyme
MVQPDGSKTVIPSLSSLLLFINNGKFGGGHSSFTPGAMMNDGLLDVMVKEGDFGFKNGLKLLKEAGKKGGKQVFRDEIEVFRAKSIKIENLNYLEPESDKKSSKESAPQKEVVPSKLSLETPDGQSAASDIKPAKQHGDESAFKKKP